MKKEVYFIGIGGIGVSALAQYYLAKGFRVSGSDMVRTEITDDLKKLGIRVFIGHKAQNIKSPELVIYSAAIRARNPELSKARKLNVKTLSYAEAIGELTKKYYTLAVSGSHGKSTTASILGLILIRAGFDPTIILGTRLKELGNKNFRLGKSKYLVLEADEWNRSFYNYYPKIAVLTNIDKEHLDTYKTLDGVIKGFARYLKNLGSDSYLVANTQDKNIVELAKKLQPKVKVIFYSVRRRTSDKLRILGEHNKLNAEAARAAAKILGIKEKYIKEVFKSFGGSWRRLEKLKKNIYTDYAHHPTEIRATLAALTQEYKNKKIICVFQPHQQDRFNRLFKDFVSVFKEVDRAIILPVYKVKGRRVLQNKNPQDLIKAVNRKNVSYAKNFKEAQEQISREPKGSIVVFMSAGDLDSEVRKIFNK